MKLILPKTLASHLVPHLSKAVDVVWHSREGLEGQADDAEVYCNDPDFDYDVHHQVLTTASKLRWYHATSAGVNHILNDLRPHRFHFTNSAGIFAEPIAETVIGYILAQAKAFFYFRSQQKMHQWDTESDTDTRMYELAGRTLLVIGAGGIGQAIARRASALGLRVLGVRRHPFSTPYFEQVVGTEWRSLLPDAHFVVLSTPLTSETEGLIDMSALRSMRADAYLINVGRGELVDETALVEALQQGYIAGSALDTFHTEPLPIDSPLWSLDNVFITPHASGFSCRNLERIAGLFLSNLDRYRKGKPLRNQVDLLAGY